MNLNPGDSNRIESFNAHIEEKLQNFNPTIMIYGVYNAGKSTLINAIFGVEEMAKTGDAPETSEVKAYTYNGYTIYDTPGINAPIEHQLVTDEHLRKSELILFVLSNEGSFEEQYIYEKIGEIIRAKKPILIAINNKSGVDMNSIDAINEINKVNQHLSTICDEMGIPEAEKHVTTAYVDAKTALEGKVEQEQELIDESGIVAFEHNMNALLGSAGKDEVINALNLYISDFINETLEIIDQKIDNPQMQKTQELITYLEKLKERTFIELKEIVVQSITVAAGKLLQFMLEGDKKAINDLVRETIEEINQKISKKIQEVQKEIRRKIEDFTLEFEQLSAGAHALQSDTNENIPAAPSSDDKQVATAAATISALIPPTATVPSPFGPIPLRSLVALVGVLWDIFSGSDAARNEAQAKLEAKREQYLAAKTASERFAIEYKDQLVENVKDNIDNTFNKVLQQYTEFAKQLERGNSKLIEDKNKLRTILGELK